MSKRLDVISDQCLNGNHQDCTATWCSCDCHIDEVDEAWIQGVIQE